MEILNEKKNPFMERTELNIAIEHEGKATPTRAEIRKLVADKINKDEDNVEIKNIYSEHGSAKSSVKIYAWDKKKVPLKRPKKAPESSDSGDVKKEDKPTEKTETSKEDAKVDDKKEEIKETAKSKPAQQNKSSARAPENKE